MFAQLRRPILWILLTLLLAAPVGAQESTPEPEPGAPAPSATPEPLPTRGPRPRSFAITNDDRAALQFFFENVVPQGQTRLARVVGDDIVAVRADWLGSVVDFWPADDGSYYGLLAADMETPISNSNPLAVTVTYRDGASSTLNANAPIVQGSFINQSLTIPAAKGYLLDPVTERAELARLGVVTARSTPERRWDASGFILPIQAGLNSPFGAVRTFNGTYRTRHTGWDIRVVGGQPVAAMAAGTIVLVDTLPIRGHYVLIDHGYGVYSGYAHLAEVFVDVGHRVDQGSVIGTVGDNGRTSGPHFHWETAVDGVWVDSVHLLEMWMP
ncbi:MAG TPA: M23 family metallopeptidase [Candidatus Limnocylindrales bacterium]|nr:M23 family metallopeptidase [Candidatus Limnocylindrales bacterium]